MSQISRCLVLLCFFGKKADGSLRMACDWRQLNKITIKNKACMPNADDLFDVVQGCEYFSKLDLHSGYNQVRIKDSDVAKTVINTPFGHFQFRVMGRVMLQRHNLSLCQLDHFILVTTSVILLVIDLVLTMTC